MAKISKQDLKRQKELLKLLEEDRKLTDDEIWTFYEEFDPVLIDNLTDRGVFFTPIMLAQDVAIMAPKYGHIVDVCAGIGMLSYRLKQMDSYTNNIQSLTCIELNPEFVEIGKRLLPEANWICGNAFDKALWDELTDGGNRKFDLMVSNPPFGKLDKSNVDFAWMNYRGELDAMVIELSLRFAETGYFILPQNAVEFKYSGRPYYEECQSKKINALRKANPELDFRMVCDGIDSSIYVDDWKNTKVLVEAVHLIQDPAEF